MGTTVLTLPGQRDDDSEGGDSIPLKFTASMCASPVGSVPTSLAPSSFHPGASRPGTSGGGSRPGTSGGA